MASGTDSLESAFRPALFATQSLQSAAANAPAAHSAEQTVATNDTIDHSHQDTPAADYSHYALGQLQTMQQMQAPPKSVMSLADQQKLTQHAMLAMMGTLNDAQQKARQSAAKRGEKIGQAHRGIPQPKQPVKAKGGGAKAE